MRGRQVTSTRRTGGMMAIRFVVKKCTTAPIITTNPALMMP